MMTSPQLRSWQPKQLDAGMFQAEISSFRLHLAAEGKSAKTVPTYTELLNGSPPHILQSRFSGVWPRCCSA
jgi:hypothetical protein